MANRTQDPSAPKPERKPRTPRTPMDPEVAAMADVLATLTALPIPARRRVLEFVTERLGSVAE